ncbi:MAG: hypothetical protein ACO32I_02745 [Candidatus Limnocylindrus sp.]
MATQTFELVSPFLSIYAPSRTFGGDPSLLKGQTENALIPGELLSFDANYGVTRVKPAAFNDGSVGDANDKPGFVFFSETGRGDIVTGGKVPVLQFGPFEADTMVFQRNTAGTLVIGDDSTELSTNHIGARVGVVAVRHPLKYSNANAANANGSLIIPGLGILHNDQVAGGAFVVGRIARVLGTGANMKVRVLFGIN